MFIPTTSSTWQLPYHVKHNGTLTSKHNTMNTYRETQVSPHTALNCDTQYRLSISTAYFECYIPKKEHQSIFVQRIEGRVVPGPVQLFPFCSFKNRSSLTKSTLNLDYKDQPVLMTKEITDAKHTNSPQARSRVLL